VIDGAARLLVANLTSEAQDVVVAPLRGDLRLRRLHAASAEAACTDPEAFRAGGDAGRADGELALRLEPYEVVRVEPV
jgi:hypothetical protein